MVEVVEFGGIALRAREDAKSASVASGMPAGAKAVPSSVLVPIRRGTLTKFPRESWMEG